MAQIHVLGLNAGKFENLGGSNDSGGLIAQPSGATSPGLEVQHTALATAQTLTLVCSNPTAATVGVKAQYSPMTSHSGSAWSNTLGVSKRVDFATQLVTAESGPSTPPSGKLHYYYRYDGGAWSDIAYLDNDGLLNIPNLALNSFTVGSIPFVKNPSVGEPTGKLAEDNANLFWDNASNELGVGTNAPGGRLHVNCAAGYTAPGVLIDYDDEGHGLEINTTAFGGIGIVIVGTGNENKGIEIDLTGSSGSNPGVDIMMPATGASGLRVTHANSAASGSAIYVSMTGATGTMPAVDLNHAGAGIGLDVDMTLTTNSAAGIDVAHFGSGNGITVTKSPATAKAGYGIGVTMGANCTAAGMYVSNGGVGESIYIEHGTSTAEGILINTGGASTGLRISTGHASAYGISVEDNEGSSNPGITVSQGGTGAGVSVTQYGTGRGVYINLSSTSNAAAGLDILYPGNGNGITINKSPTTSKAGYGLGVTMGANCTGDGINLSTANSTDGSTGIRVTSAPTTSAAVTIYGAQISVTSGTTFQNRALYLSASGGTTNYALYANAGDTYLNGALTVTGNTQLGDAGTDTLAIYPTSTTLYSQVGSAPAWLNAIFGTTLHPTGLITNVAKVGGIQAGDPVIATLRGADSAASDAGMVMLLGGDATASNYKGGWALSMGGVGFGSGSGGNCLGIAGAGGATGAGGDAMLWSGAGGATTGNSGVLTLTTGATTSGNSGEATLSTGIPASGSSGKITISTGGTTTGSSGTAELRTGAVATTGSSGSITIVTGNTADVSGVSGSISLEIGTAAGGTGGTVNLAYTGTTATVRIGQPTSTVNVYPYFATFAPTASSYTTKSILGTTLAIAGIVTAQPDDGAGHQGFTTVRGCDRTTAGKAGSSMLLGGDHNGNNGEGGITAVISGKGGASDGTAGAGAGGAVVVYTGLGGTASGTYPGGKGGDLLLWGNTGGAGTATGNAGHGGDIQLAAGAAGAANGGNGERGGDINLGAGTGTGTGRGGRIGIDSGVGGGGAGESITIGGSNAASLALGRAAITTTINGTLNLGGSACSANVTGTNLSTLTAGASSDASALHTHVGMPLSSNYTAGTGGVTQYDVVYLANDGGNLRAFPAFATSETTTRPIGLAMATAAAGISFAAALGGEYTAHFDSTPAAADAGKPVYLSVSAAGQVSLTAPTTTGQVSMRIGYLAQISGTAYCKIALHIGDPFVQ